MLLGRYGVILPFRDRRLPRRKKTLPTGPGPFRPHASVCGASDRDGCPGRGPDVHPALALARSWIN